MPGKRTLLLLLSFGLFASSFAQQTGTAKDTTPTEHKLMSALLGTREIDLRPNPQAPPYLKEFTISTYEGKNLRGFFYNTPFEGGKINTAWGKVYFAFTTADNSGTYYHSGYLENGKLYGTSFSSGRGFMSPWFSTRKK